MADVNVLLLVLDSANPVHPIRDLGRTQSELKSMVVGFVRAVVLAQCLPAPLQHTRDELFVMSPLCCLGQPLGGSGRHVLLEDVLLLLCWLFQSCLQSFQSIEEVVLVQVPLPELSAESWLVSTPQNSTKLGIVMSARYSSSVVPLAMPR